MMPPDAPGDEDVANDIDDALLHLVECGQLVAICATCRTTVTPEAYDECTCPRCGDRDPDAYIFGLPS